MKQVLVLAFCDVHRARDEKVESDGEVTVRINGTERLLDLCGECRMLLVDPLAEAMKLGAKVDVATPTAARPKAENPPKRPRPAQRDSGEGWVGDDPVAENRCPICHAQYASRGSMQGHVNKYHEMPLRAAEEQMGLPITGTAKAYSQACPECGQVCTSPQGMGAHRRTHGVNGGGSGHNRGRDEARARARAEREQQQPVMAA